MFSRIPALAVLLITFAFFQRTSSISICDTYSAQIFGNNTAASQLSLITLLFNTIVIGNYTSPNIGVSVLGIANSGVYNGTFVNLLPYFTGAYNSTNDGFSPYGVSKLFLDDGGAVPLSKSLPSNGNINSAQYNLLTHIYEYFGTLLGCSLQGGENFPSYQGRTSMYEVHKYMDLDSYQMGFFILQATNAAISIGFSPDDVAIWERILEEPFNTRCTPPLIISNINMHPQLQSVCLAPTCPLRSDANCTSYPGDGIALSPVNISSVATSNTSTSTASISTPSTISTTGGGLPIVEGSLGVVLTLILALAVGFVWELGFGG